MNRDTILEAKEEAERFLHLARALLAMKVPTYQDGGAYRDEPWKAHGAPAQQGAVRRASLDLTRSLARMRKAS